MNEFRLLIETYKDRLLKHAFYRIGNIEEAEDIVQEVFMKVYRQKLFSTMKTPGAFLYRMTANACLDYLRKCELELRLQDRLGENKENFAYNEAIENIALREEFDRIDRILQTLSQDQADVIRFRIIDGLSFKEIAKIVVKPESTVKSRFQYGIEKLKQQQTEQCLLSAKG